MVLDSYFLVKVILPMDVLVNSVNDNVNFPAIPHIRIGTSWSGIVVPGTGVIILGRVRDVPKQVHGLPVRDRLDSMGFLSIGINKKREPNEDHPLLDYPSIRNPSYPYCVVRDFRSSFIIVEMAVVLDFGMDNFVVQVKPTNCFIPFTSISRTVVPIQNISIVLEPVDLVWILANQGFKIKKEEIDVVSIISLKVYKLF